MFEYEEYRKMIKMIEMKSSELFTGSSNEFAKQMIKLYDMLRRRKCTSYKTARRAPGDDIGWAGKTPQGYKCLYLSNMNCEHYNYVVVFQKTSKETTMLDCYKYYEEPWKGQEEQCKQFGGHLYYIKSADILMTYTDNINNNQYVERPNLQYIFDNLDEMDNEEKYFHFNRLFRLYDIDIKNNNNNELKERADILSRNLNHNCNREMVWRLKDISMVGRIATSVMFDMTRPDRDR